MTASDAGWQRRPPLALVADLFPAMGATLRSVWPVLLLMVVRGGMSAEVLVLLVELGISLTLLVGLSLVRVTAAWVSTTWRLLDDRLEVQTGLLSRQHRVITAGRVQNAEVRQDLPQRVLGLATVRVETASGEGAEGTLTGITQADAERIVAILGRGARPASTAPDDLVLALGPAELAMVGAVSTRWGLLAVGALILWDRVLMPSMSDPGDGARAVVGAAQTLGGAGAVAVALVALAGVWLAGIVGTVVRHWGFELRRDAGGGLRAEEGLFTRRRVALPAGRVQRVEVVEGLLARQLGFATLHLESVVARTGEGGADRSAVTVPLVAAAEVDALVRRLLPEVAPGAWRSGHRGAHPRAARREVGRAALRGALVLGVGAWWSWWILPPLGVVAVWWVVGAVLDVRAQGWRVDPEFVVGRTGWWHRRTVVLPRRRVQVAAWRQGPLLRLIGLAEVWVSVAGNGATLPLVDADEGWRLATSLAASRPEAAATSRAGAALAAADVEDLGPTEDDAVVTADDAAVTADDATRAADEEVSLGPWAGAVRAAAEVPYRAHVTLLPVDDVPELPDEAIDDGDDEAAGPRVGAVAGGRERQPGPDDAAVDAAVLAALYEAEAAMAGGDAAVDAAVLAALVEAEAAMAGGDEVLDDAPAPALDASTDDVPDDGRDLATDEVGRDGRPLGQRGGLDHLPRPAAADGDEDDVVVEAEEDLEDDVVVEADDELADDVLFEADEELLLDDDDEEEVTETL